MKRLIFAAFVLLISVAVFGQDPRAARFDSLFSALTIANSFNGNVLIAENGKVIFEKSYGLADESSKRPLNSGSVFELASVSKQFTAMGIVLLNKQGKLSYGDNISKYIPELDFYENITITNLLNHTSGLPDYMNLFEDKWDKTKFATNQDIVNEFLKHRPEVRFKPNERFEYSNTGYALLGLIIERVSGKSFGDFLQENIFKPLGMNNTLVYRSRYKPQKMKNYAYGYVQDSTGNKVLTDSFGKTFFTYYLDGIVGDGMVNSTARDLLKWDRALYGNKLADENDKKQIFQSSKTADGKENSYGFGWFITKNDTYGKIVNHGGGWAGYTTYIERHLINDKTVILLQNNSLPSTKLPIKEVRNILYNEPIKAESQIALTAEELDRYTGLYSNESFPLKIRIMNKDGRLHAQATGQNEIALDAFENHTFRFKPAGIKMVFNIEDKTFELNQGGMIILFKKE
ncbi:MAG: beta-lactamase family protein [Bacteroidia bacterium]|jgi:CubicO group peptidase (beta-lactamase class C family)|nr:beta-lactamase family protein [Bacteroidia bacterium]